MQNFREILSDRTEFIPLLLQGDEDIAMLCKYLHKGRLFALCDVSSIATLALVVAEGNTAELMNIVTAEEKRGKGFGSAMIEHLAEEFSHCDYLIAGTGDSSPARAFYEKNGFTAYGMRKDFFLQYDHQIMENGNILRDMILYRKPLR